MDELADLRVAEHGFLTGMITFLPIGQTVGFPPSSVGVEWERCIAAVPSLAAIASLPGPAFQASSILACPFGLSSN